MIAACAVGLMAAGQGRAAERLGGEQIKRAFEGNTVTGLYTGSNLPFSEYHHPEDRKSVV